MNQFYENNNSFFPKGIVDNELDPKLKIKARRNGIVFIGLIFPSLCPLM
jgi:hypothetical protein